MNDVSLAERRGNDLTFKVRGEDISVLYILAHELVSMDDVILAGVVQRHYLIDEYEFRVNTKESLDPFDAMRNAVDGALRNVREIKGLLSV
jgi:DNA-directed RNA polymerase subunit L